ncbi:DNA-binding GntR family transcriptional regulator [Nocardiopsis mwathae]|uniref:DNA-binding GntR family transcriptional regulator n=1 Tax=Nocardiopsis mwathae TaxID=1472723 RepID=A0A7W9YIQ6_9ACTN|nr:DNA-binding GntR family transcriptional regulator [Nocardiopsis mwathae]
MAEIYGVAKMTVARAVRELRDRQLAITVRGKGTVVAEQSNADGGQ